MTQPRRPYGVYIHNLRVEVVVPYNAAWLDELKSSTRWDERRWHPIEKMWSLAIGLAEWAVKMCGRHFPHVPAHDLRGTSEAHNEPFSLERTEEESEFSRKAAEERARHADDRRARDEAWKDANARAKTNREREAQRRTERDFKVEFDVEFEDFRTGDAAVDDFFQAFYRAAAGEAYKERAHRKPPPSSPFGGDRREERQRTWQSPPRTSGGPATLEQAFVELLRQLPNEALAKVYKVAIAAAHPDAGGDHEKAVAVNRAWDAIKKFRRIT